MIERKSLSQTLIDIKLAAKWAMRIYRGKDTNNDLNQSSIPSTIMSILKQNDVPIAYLSDKILDQADPLQRNNNQVIIVSSTSTPEDCPKDVVLQKELEMKGIIVMDRYIKKIEEIYQLSDCYVFSVTFEGGCISIPLSVLEAMACNLPVITTKFGELPGLFTERDGFMYATNEEEFVRKINIAKNMYNIETTEMVKHYSWDKLIEKLEGCLNGIIEKN